MNQELRIYDEFGPFCADGGRAVSFFKSSLVPLLESGQEVVVNFSGVRNLNSSFSNALLSSMILKYGPSVCNRVRFSNVRKNVQILIETSISLGKSLYEQEANISSQNAA